MANKKLIINSALVYIVVQMILGALSGLGALEVSRIGYFIASFLAAIYYYQTRKYGYFLDPRHFKKGSKINWKFLILSVIVYYVIVLTVNYMLYYGGKDYQVYRLYTFLVSFILAAYFYQFLKIKFLKRA